MKEIILYEKAKMIEAGEARWFYILVDTFGAKAVMEALEEEIEKKIRGRIDVRVANEPTEQEDVEKALGRPQAFSIQEILDDDLTEGFDE